METRKCGEIPIGNRMYWDWVDWSFGGWPILGGQDQKDRLMMLSGGHIEFGVTILTQPEAYNDGKSEESLGLAIKGVPQG